MLWAAFTGLYNINDNLHQCYKRKDSPEYQLTEPTSDNNILQWNFSIMLCEPTLCRANQLLVSFQTHTMNRGHWTAKRATEQP